MRKSPGKAVLIAVGTGYVLSQLPLRAIIASQIRLAAALAPPALLALGAVKLCEFLKFSSRPRAGRVLQNSGELPSLDL